MATLLLLPLAAHPPAPRVLLAHAAPPHRAAIARSQRTPPLSATAAAEGVRTLLPLYTFSGEGVGEEISKWERIDDVIMGGVSNSRLVASSDEECAYFEGRLRELGGGFCGQRMRLLSAPLDLSDSAGIYLDCEADADAPSRAFKVALRTRQDRSEVVYQAQFSPPPLTRSTVFLPFDAFRLVRGPRLVPGVPPLSAAQANETFQMSIVVSKFAISSDGAAISNFKEGRFRLKLFSVGTFAEDGKARGSPDMPTPLTAQQQQASRPLPLKLLAPVLSLLFGETRRRRRAATQLLRARGVGRWGRLRLSWAIRRAGGRVSLAQAALRQSVVLMQDAMALALSLPARALAFVIFRSLRLLRQLKRKEPKMPPLRSA